MYAYVLFHDGVCIYIVYIYTYDCRYIHINYETLTIYIMSKINRTYNSLAAVFSYHICLYDIEIFKY